MGKLSEIFKGSISKFNSLSKFKKIALGVGVIGLVAAGIFLTTTLGATKYGVLFNNLDPNDAKTVMDQLNQKKVTNVKISGNSILVPENQVDQLRLELASSLSSGSKGFELFDSSSTFGSTDAEEKVKYQRALEGELEKTIKGFSQVQNVKVNLVLPDDSVFVQDSTPASASVTLMMKPGQNLSNDQVKAIVALLTGGVKNLPKENVQIVDNNMKLLTQNLYDTDSNGSAGTETDKQQQLTQTYEKQLEAKVMDQLSKPFKNKVTVKVNADLDFDAVQSDTTKVDPKGTIVSEKYIRDTNGDVTARPSQSPVDNNMTNSSTTTTQNTNSGTVTHQEETNNYEISKSETKSIKAPGAVKRLTASVIIDGNVDDALKTQIQDIVGGAIGLDSTRGDSIAIAGMKFDTTDADAAKKAIDDMNKAQAQANKMNLYKELAIGGGILAGLIMLFILARKGKKSSTEEEQLDAIVSPKSIDVLVGEDSSNVQFKPIDFDKVGNSERTHIEKEIKRYASEKPDQVADIIKSWLAEEERG